MQSAAYGDILNRERPVHRNDTFFFRHPTMPISQRAKIFAPYDALAGFSGEVGKKEISYEPKRVLDADETWELNRRLSILRDLTINRRAVQLNHPVVCVEHFVVCDDPHHDGFGRLGQYKALKGTARKVDPVKQVLWVEGQALSFSDIYDITDPEGRLFRRRG